MAYLSCNESFINPSYSERMGLTYRQAKGKLTLKDKIRLKLMKYLGKSREGLAAKLQDKSLKAAGYAIRNPGKVAAGTALVLGAGYGANRLRKNNSQNTTKNNTNVAKDNNTAMAQKAMKAKPGIQIIKSKSDDKSTAYYENGIEKHKDNASGKVYYKDENGKWMEETKNKSVGQEMQEKINTALKSETGQEVVKKAQETGKKVQDKINTALNSETGQKVVKKAQETGKKVQDKINTALNSETGQKVVGAFKNIFGGNKNGHSNQ